MYAVAMCLAYVANPPRPLIALGGGDDWTFTSIDLQRGSGLLSEFSRTYGMNDVDFSTNPIVPSPVPQGFMGFSYKGDVRMLMHFTRSNRERRT